MPGRRPLHLHGISFTGESREYARILTAEKWDAAERKFPLELSNSARTSNTTNYQAMGMTDVIEFLERMGKDPQLRHAAPDELERALISAEIAPELRAAILARDQAQLETLLGGVPVCGYFFPSKEDEGDEDEDEGEEAPSKEPDEAPEHSGLRTAIPTA